MQFVSSVAGVVGWLAVAEAAAVLSPGHLPRAGSGAVSK